MLLYKNINASIHYQNLEMGARVPQGVIIALKRDEYDDATEKRRHWVARVGGERRRGAI